MKRLLTFTLVLLALAARADQGATEPPLSAKAQAQAIQTLNEALADKTISKQQFDEALSWVRSTPCAGVDRSLTGPRKLELGRAIAKQEKRKRVDVYQSFSDAGWSIIYLGTRISDNGYFFYSGDPLAAARAVTVWSGAAPVFEASEIAQWVLKNVPGIPPRLAKCFAWHVTLNRDL